MDAVKTGGDADLALYEDIPEVRLDDHEVRKHLNLELQTIRLANEVAKVGIQSGLSANELHMTTPKLFYQEKHTLPIRTAHPAMGALWRALSITVDTAKIALSGYF